MNTATEQAASLVNSRHQHKMEGRELFAVLLDVIKAFPSTIHELIFSMFTHASLPPNHVAAFRKVNAHANTYMHIQGNGYISSPREASNKDAPAPHFCSLLYMSCSSSLIARYPNTFIHVDDIDIILKNYY